jgi:hypothetical protein
VAKPSNPPSQSGIVLPSIPDYLSPVLTLLAAAVPQEVRPKCYLENGTQFPATAKDEVQQAFLVNFVGEKLDRIARYEYRHWLNGRMPFVSPRQLQLWRLRQFAEFIMDWDLPDDEVLAVVFNLTSRQAGSLVSDFYAKFRKLYVFPRVLQRLFALLDVKPQIPQMPYQGVIGRVYKIPSKRYLEEMNAVINDLRESHRREILVSAAFFRRNQQLMWVAERVIETMNDKTTRDILTNLYPIGGEVDE